MTKSRNKIMQRTLGKGLTASAISFGAMGLSEFYGKAVDQKAAMEVLDKALELGISMVDTADMYGRGENERLIGAFLARHPAERRQGLIRIATKCGIERDPEHAYNRRINNRPEYIRASCAASLKRLGVECIDCYYLHRLDPDADLTASMETLAELKQEGKIDHIGLCEVSAASLARAHAIHPVSVVQSEYSLWSREPEEALLPLCRELGIGFVAYSPLGRGFLTGRLASTDHLDAGDFRLSNPRFQPGNLEKNALLLPSLQAVAERHACTPAQAALAWLLGRYPSLVAIPGTRNPKRLQENCAAAAIQLKDADSQLLDRVFSRDAVHGERYSPEGMKGCGT